MALQVGDAAPAFSLGDQNGTSVSLEQFRGQRVVIYFYPKDDTPGCTKEACNFRDQWSVFAQHNIAVLGISKDGAASHGKFIAKYDLKVALGSDPEGSMIEAYGAWVEKSMYGRKYMGIERSTFLIGADGGIRRIWRKVKVPGHAAEVLKAAQGL